MKRLFILLLLFSLFPYTLLYATTINKIVAVVGDEVLTLYELDQMVDNYYHHFVKKELPPEELNKIREKLRKDLLAQWIEDTVIGLEVKKYGIKVSDEEVAEFFKEELNKEKGELTPEEKEKLKDSLKKMKFIQLMVREKIAIPEDELKKAYKEYIKNYDPTPKYKLEVLIVKEELLVKELYESALRGISLQELWKKNQENTQYISEIFKEEEIEKNLREQLKELKPGELLEPIKRGEVYQIIRLVKKEEGNPPAFEEIRKNLYEELFQKKAKDYLEKWIKELKESKFVKVYL
ncbi:MAG: peptidyl-prolyl cis-trans isomerase [Caldimicrobium sp.]